MFRFCGHVAEVLNDKSDLALLIKASNKRVPLNYTCVVSGDYVYQALALNYQYDKKIMNSARKKNLIYIFNLASSSMLIISRESIVSFREALRQGAL